MVAFRYLRARRQEGFISVIAGFSLLGIALGVATLIIVMSVMNGFRTELLDRTLGFNGHVYVAGGSLYEPEVQTLAGEIAALPGVTQAAPLVEAQAMALGQGQISGVVVRGISEADLRRTEIVSSNIVRGSLEGFGVGEYGGDMLLIGDRLADTLGVQPGDSSRGNMKLMAVDQNLPALLRLVWASLFKQMGKARMQGIHLEQGDIIRIEGDHSSVILDGELFEASEGRPIVLRSTKPVPFLRLAA